MNIWKITISSGGTIVPIDAMRTISNKSWGRTWAHLAEEFLEAWHKVDYITTWNTALPYIHHLQKMPISFQDGDENWYQILQEKINSEALHIIETWYFDEYQKAMIQHASNSQPGDVAIVAAAVSDYGMDTVEEGKISSEQKELSLKLKKLPKVIELMRQVSPSLVMVWFKLLPTCSTPDETYQALINASIKQMQWKSETDLVVANSSTSKPWTPSIGIKDTLIVHKDGSFKKIDRRNLWTKLLEEIPGLIDDRLKAIGHHS